MTIKTDSVIRKEKIGVGKRKQAVARVFLYPGNGNLLINKIPGEKYLQYNTMYLNNIWDPLKKLNLEKQFDIIALVRGGGLTGQTNAIQLGVARLICKMDQKNRSILKPYGFLTRDARIKERKKYGLRKARKAPQYSKR
uniref:Small ribosomal subunit protein uS9c n=1 Tax=Actinocyclus subtilis TaxID=1630683 RepID=A0A2U9NQA6_9STRA|nr:ribosomal protein S9 [Actinocyclus subtilis]AWT39310.1 ribosomal protein S9 [Actinocyclus subtilis]